MKAPDVLELFVCESCGKHGLEPLRPNHFQPDLLPCGGKVDKVLYKPDGAAVAELHTVGGRSKARRPPRRKAAA